MKISPVGDQVYLNMEEAALGSLDTSSMKTAMEWAIVQEIGPDVKTVKKGDKVFVKGWAIDNILYEGDDYRFTSEERKGIVAIIK